MLKISANEPVWKKIYSTIITVYPARCSSFPISFLPLFNGGGRRFFAADWALAWPVVWLDSIGCAPHTTKAGVHDTLCDRSPLVTMLVLVHAVTGLLQLCALVIFAGSVYALNQYAPRRMAARAFKLRYLLASLVGGIVVALVVGRLFSLPSLLQTTPKSLVDAHNVIRSECRDLLAAQRFDDAYDRISYRAKTFELVAENARKASENAHRKTSIARLLSPALNAILFHTGVAVAFAPVLLRLLVLLWQKKRLVDSNRLDPRFEETERREWSVFLPIMNAVTLLSLCVAPSFYLMIEPGRAHRCVYTSGHW